MGFQAGDIIVTRPDFLTRKHPGLRFVRYRRAETTDEVTGETLLTAECNCARSLVLVPASTTRAGRTYACHRDGC